MRNLSAKLSHVTTLAAACALTASVAAQSFTFPTFPNATGLALNGNASVTNNLLQLTPAANSQSSSVYYNQPVNVAGGFVTTFEFRISNDGADGFSFLIQNDPRALTARGDDGTSLAYSGYTIPGGTAVVNSIAIEFDTWDSGAQAMDTSANEVSIHTDGPNDNQFHEDYSIGRITPNTNMSDGVVHTVRIDYAPGLLTVYLDDLNNPILTAPYSFATGGTHLTGNTVAGLNLINGTSAYVGFTATTGGVTEVHEIHSWQFGPRTIGTPYCTANANSTGVTGAMSADGSDVVANNNLRLRAAMIPPNSFGFFLTSRTQAVVMNPGGSAGNLCLGGSIGRYVGAGQVQSSGAAGEILLLLNLTQTPTPTGLVQVNASETWNFQLWHRDSVGGSATSNFTNGLQVLFR